MAFPLRPVLLLALLCCTPAAAQTRPESRIGPISGKPVPRFESLKFGEVNGRIGPSLEHRVLWTYHQRRLPVEIVAESDVWRQIRDPYGDLSWVHANGLEERRTVYVAAAAPAALRRGPRESAPPTALMERGVVAVLKECKAGWRKLEAGGRTGWARAADLWGAEAAGSSSAPTLAPKP